MLLAYKPWFRRRLLPQISAYNLAFLFVCSQAQTLGYGCFAVSGGIGQLERGATCGDAKMPNEIAPKRRTKSRQNAEQNRAKTPND